MLIFRGVLFKPFICFRFLLRFCRLLYALFQRLRLNPIYHIYIYIYMNFYFIQLMNHPCLDPMICCQNSTIHHMDVSKNSGYSPQIIHLLIRFSMIFTIHLVGFPSIFGNTHMKSWKPDVSWFPSFRRTLQVPPGQESGWGIKGEIWRNPMLGTHFGGGFWVCPSHSIHGGPGIFTVPTFTIKINQM